MSDLLPADRDGTVNFDLAHQRRGIMVPLALFALAGHLKEKNACRN